MRALTLTQPWAGLVVSGIKRVENRPRAVIRNADLLAGPVTIAIHASRKIDESVYSAVEQIHPFLMSSPNQPWYRLSRITSALIGMVTVWGARYIDGWSRDVIETLCANDDIPDQACWMFGPTCYLLRDAVAFADPVPCRGWQGCWTVPDEAYAQMKLRR